MKSSAVTSDVTHDLQQPMVAIKGYLSMVLDGSAGEVSDKVKEFLKKAYESNEKMIEMVNTLPSKSEALNPKSETNSKL